MNIKIGIIDDQHQIRENLVTRFSFFEEIELVMQASNGRQALSILKKSRPSDLPDVILMDIEMPEMNGIETTKIVKELYPDIDIMMQTVFEDEDNIFKSIQVGASGYLLKDDPIEKYVDAIKDMVNGGAPISASVAIKLLNYMRRDDKISGKKTADDFSLSTRELDILQGIVDDLTEHQIGERLFISPHTVRTHIKNIYKKLHVHSRASAVKITLENNLL